MEQITVVEVKNFEQQVRDCMSAIEREEFIAFIAENPEAGDVIQGTGGIRKVRWAISGKGKRGGARIIYYYHNLNMPLFLLDVYTKSQQTDLSADDKKQLKDLVQILITSYAQA